MKKSSTKEPDFDSSDPEAIELQLRKITRNLEQLKLNLVQQERLISLTFLDLLKELSDHEKGSDTSTHGSHKQSH
jgi:hypothetical protein